MHEGRQDLASILGNLAKVLPPLPPPFQLPKPSSLEVEPSGGPSGGYVDVRDGVAVRHMDIGEGGQLWSIGQISFEMVEG